MASWSASARAQPLLAKSLVLLEAVTFNFYSALARAAACDAVIVDRDTPLLRALAGHHRQLEQWATHCPANFENRAALVGAEIARIEGRDVEAMRLYELALRSARANGFVQNEAIAYDRASAFYRARGFAQIADLYLRNARYAYLRWGAAGKVRQLDETYPQLMTGQEAPAPTATMGESSENLDLATVIKVSQAISSEMVLERLIDAIMRTAIAHAGAERGILILSRDADQWMAAEATTSTGPVVVRLRDEPATAAALGTALGATAQVLVQAILLLIAFYFLMIDGRRLVRWLAGVIRCRFDFDQQVADFHALSLIDWHRLYHAAKRREQCQRLTRFARFLQLGDLIISYIPEL